jgi:hypothetical protein
MNKLKFLSLFCLFVMSYRTVLVEYKTVTVLCNRIECSNSSGFEFRFLFTFSTFFLDYIFCFIFVDKRANGNRIGDCVTSAELYSAAMTAGADTKPGGGEGGCCTPCCRNGGAPDVPPVKPVKPLYGPERMKPVPGGR